MSIPDDAGFRSRWVSIPPSPGCRGFDPRSSSDPDYRPRVKGGLGFHPDDSWVASHGFRSLMSRVRTLGGVDPAESWVSIPDFPSKVLSKLTTKLLVRSSVRLLVRSLVSLLVNY